MSQNTAHFYSNCFFICNWRYFISNISIEYLVLKNELSVFTKMINLILPDIGYFSKIGYDLLYSNLYYLTLCIVIILVILLIYKKTDITN